MIAGCFGACWRVWLRGVTNLIRRGLRYRVDVPAQPGYLSSAGTGGDHSPEIALLDLIALSLLARSR